MKVLAWGSILYITAFVLHFIVWKIRVPARQVKRMMQIKVLVLLTGLLLLYLGGNSSAFVASYGPYGIFEYIHIALFFVSVLLAYMITYSAIEADSPSLVMVMAIAEADGLDRKEFFRRMNDDVLIKPRVRDLVKDKMADLDDDRYRLTPKGILMARIFIFYRGLLKLGKGG